MKHGHRCLVGALVIVVLGVALALITTGEGGSLAAHGVIYVDADATGLNDGSTWDNAYTDLQLALDAAPLSGDQIWVAEGIYKPTVQHGDTGDRYKSFQMKNGVAIYGGFDPSLGATDWGHRNWVTHVVILSGDLNSNDVPPFGNNGDNSYHVFYHPVELALDGSAILDGFTVTGGNADLYDPAWESPHGQGGGMYNHNSSPMLTNCTFHDNWANYRGGGIYNSASSPTLINCTLEGNSVYTEGGSMYNLASSPTLTNCTFHDNSAGSEGGGIYNHDSSPTLTDCTFEGNSVGYGGGGMYNEDSSPTLTDCTFEGNSATYVGGGIDNYSGSSPTLINCTFEGNFGREGGGVANYFHSSPTLTNCTFSDNSAEIGGGTINVFGSSPALTNCTFEGNSATVNGGGILNQRDSSPSVTNCILWGDTPNEISNEGSSRPSVAYSDVQGGYGGVGNIAVDPLFVDAANRDFHLGLDSPCIDVGYNAPNLPPHDFEGDPRVLDGDGNVTRIVDMGVDEVAVDWPYFHAYLPVVLRDY